jgi:hypothetical protein
LEDYVRQIAAISMMILCGCAPLTGVELELDASTSELHGWFAAKEGVWTLFPPANLNRAYQLYPENRDQKCVALVNATGLLRTDYDTLDGRLVTVIGMALSYDSLDIIQGEGGIDGLLQRRYYNG